MVKHRWGYVEQEKLARALHVAEQLTTVLDAFYDRGSTCPLNVS